MLTQHSMIISTATVGPERHGNGRFLSAIVLVALIQLNSNCVPINCSVEVKVLLNKMWCRSLGVEFLFALNFKFSTSSVQHVGNTKNTSDPPLLML